MGKLTAVTVRNASRPGLHGDGATLYLAVAPGGSKSWIQRVTIHGRRRDIGLGGYPAVSLAKARLRAMANRVAIADGIDPLAGKRRANTPTFRAAAVATFKANRPRWRAARTARAWMQSLEKHAFPEIGALRVDTITQDDILRILKPLWSTRPQLARKLRQRIRATLQWCQAHGHVGANAAGEAIDGALPAMPAVKAHYRALPWAEVGAALDAVPNEFEADSDAATPIRGPAWADPRRQEETRSEDKPVPQSHTPAKAGMDTVLKRRPLDRSRRDFFKTAGAARDQSKGS